jgi:hypothetical protein
MGRLHRSGAFGVAGEYMQGKHCRLTAGTDAHRLESKSSSRTNK